MKENTKIYNSNLEQIVIGMIILNSEYIHKVNEYLIKEDFYFIEHQIIFNHINEFFISKNSKVNSITLVDFFENEENLKKLGGKNYLTFLETEAIPYVDILDFILTIKDFSEKRKLILIAENLILNTKSQYTTKKSKELAEEAENEIAGIINGLEVKKGFTSINNSFNDLLKDIEDIKENGRSKDDILTGYKDLDFILNGFKPSNLIVIGAKSGMGKSAFALNIALNIAKDFRDNNSNKSVGFFSLEMSEKEVNSRILSIESGLNSYSFSNGTLTEENFDIIKEKSIDIKKIPLYIDDTSGINFSALKSRAKRLKENKNMSILFIDYLQIMSSKHESEYNKITELTRELKILAGDLQIPIVVLSQLSRVSDSREDKRPILSDLRASGSIEQDANIVLFLHREDYYKKDFKDLKEVNLEIEKPVEIGKTNIIVAKNRSGKLTTINLQYISNTTKFINYDKQ